MKNVLIIGAGKFGSLIAKRMSELGCAVMVVDKNENNINELLPYVTNAIIGDSTSEEFVDTLGVSDYDVCFVSIGNDFQTSLEVTALLKDAGARYLVCRASSDIQSKFLDRIGADAVVYPEKQMARRIATKYASDNILDYIQLDNSSHALYQLRVPSEWYGHSLKGLDIRRKYNINIVALWVGNDITVPDADTVFKENDTVLAIGDRNNLLKVFKIK
ncbi:MAG: TrkA family potassium uptake protein [Erysipelotrichaceae bacterium]|nr:TrkA family potassium uptake protein [Erysipelotrichaceae bacterium]